MFVGNMYYFVHILLFIYLCGGLQNNTVAKLKKKNDALRKRLSIAKVGISVVRTSNLVFDNNGIKSNYTRSSRALLVLLLG